MRKYKTIDTKLKEIEADKDFIDFILEWFHFGEPLSVIPINTYYNKRKKEINKDSFYRNIKRQYQKKYKDNWKKKWKEHLSKIKDKDRGSLVCLHTPDTPDIYDSSWWVEYPPKKKPINKSLWNCVFMLKEYFLNLTGKPQWDLIADIINTKISKADIIDANSIQRGFNRRKKDYILNGKSCMLSYKEFYERIKK